MANILLNKPATASNSFAPFLPSRAVDGVTTDPKSRWVSSVLPAWLMVDLQANYYINQWSAYFMGSVGWAASYNLSDFKLQGSLDGTNWFDMDALTGNTASQITRTITPQMVRYLRVYITKGLTINNQVASIVDFQASEPANAPFLSALVPDTGTLSPAFSSRTLKYTINVANTVNTIKFTPTALQSNMTIKVNNVAVVSGQSSNSITLNVGNNNIPVEVTSNDGTMKTTYTITVVKADVANLLLTQTVVAYSGRSISPGSATVPMNSNDLTYSATVPAGATAITVAPYAADATVVIRVNNVVVASGTASGSITLGTATPAAVVSITVTSANGLSVRNYTLNVSKANS
jgi:hypothetical protein